MFVKMIYSKECLGVLEKGDPLKIFLALLITPPMILVDIICLPLEISALIISKIISINRR